MSALWLPPDEPDPLPAWWERDPRVVCAVIGLIWIALT